MGLGKESRRFVVKDLCHREKVNILVLQETKLQKFRRSMEIDLWGRRSFEYVLKSAVGRSSGVLVAFK